MVKIDSKKIVTSGPIMPSIVNVPLDIRTRVNTIDDIYNIELPYVGMIVYVIEEDKYYKIKTLKALEITGVTNIVIDNALVDTFEEILTKEDVLIKLQQQVEQLQSTVNELIQIPEIVIANRNIESEMEYLNEKTQDENVIGIIIDPYITPANSPNSDSIFYFEYTLEFINNLKNKIDSYDKITTIVKTKDHIYMMHHHLYDGNWSYLTKSIGDTNGESIQSIFKDASGKDIGQEEGKKLVAQLRNNTIELEMEILIYVYIVPNEFAMPYIKLLKVPYSTKIRIKEL